MHDIDPTQLEAAEGYRSPHSDEFGPGSAEIGEAGRFDESAGLAPEHQSSLGEREMEFAAELLEVSSEEELEQLVSVRE